MIETDELYTVEYSVDQECFHVDMLNNTLKNNRINFFLNNSNDYQILAICDSWEKAQAKAREFRELRK